MLKLARWSTTHRWYVLLGWIVLLLVVDAFAHRRAPTYSNNFTLPNSDAQRAADLLRTQLPGAGRRPRHDRLRGQRRHGARPGRARADERDVRRSRQAAARLGRDQPLRGRLRPARRSRPTARSRSRPSCSTRKPTCCPRARPNASSRRRPRRRAGRACEVELGGQAIEADRAGRLRHRHGGRAAGGDRRAAADVRLADRDGAADRHRAVRPRHRPRRDRPVHARRRHAELLLRARGDDRAGRGDRLRAVHPHALSRGLRHARTDVRERARVGRAGDGHRRTRRPVRRHDGRDRAARDDAARRRIPLRGGDLGVDRRAAGDARLADAAARAADVRRRPRRAADGGARAERARASRSAGAALAARGGGPIA